MSEQHGFDLLAQKRKALKEGIKLQEAQNTQAKLTARQRIETLLDPQSFVETLAFVQHSSAPEGLKEVSAPGEGVVTGYGTVDGRGVYVFSQDYNVLGGAMGVMHARKIQNILELAGKTGLPVVALIDSMGARIGEGAGTLEGYGSILKKLAELSGVVPVITVVCGPCAGTAAFLVSLSDFIFMSKDIGGIYSAAPGAYNEPGKAIQAQDIGGPTIHAEKTGLVHFLSENENDALYSVRHLLSYLPDNNLVDAPVLDCGDDLNRLIDEYQGAFDVRSLIGAVMDSGDFFESQQAYAPSIITGLGRLNGRSVGIVANANGAYIDEKSASKAAGFVSFCDAFGLPVLTFADTPGFIKDLTQENLIQAGARLIRAYAEATVPLLTVITGQAVGSGYVAMAPKALGADMVFAWPEAVISAVLPNAAAVILMNETITASDDVIEARKEAANTYANTYASPWQAAKMGYVDEVIYPSETRQRLAAALELALGKREKRLPKKHGTRLY